MISLLVLIPVSLAMGLIGLGAFFWAMRSNQFDDPDGNAWRVLSAADHPKDNPPETEGKNDDLMDPHLEDRNPAGGV